MELYRLTLVCCTTRVWMLPEVFFLVLYVLLSVLVRLVVNMRHHVVGKDEIEEVTRLLVSHVWDCTRVFCEVW